MTQHTLKDLSARMRRLDITMLGTRRADGTLASRPMSNNRDVEYDGTSYFFTSAQTGCVVEHDPNVLLAYQGDQQFYISVEGQAKVIRDKSRMAPHWVPDLEKWFEQGLNTPDLVMLQVDAKTIRYWDQGSEGELNL